MGIPNKEIGWSKESSLLQYISKQLERLTQVTAAFGGGGGGGVSANVNVAKVDNNTVDVNTGNASDGTMRVVLASNQPSVDVEETNSSAIKTAVELLDNAVDGNALNTNMQISGADVSAGTGNVDGTTQRITLASDDPAVNLLKTLPIVYGEPYLSPQDFSVAWASGTTLTVTGAPFDIDDSANYVAAIIVKNNAGTVTKYYNGHNGVSISASSNTITISGVAGTPFASNDAAYRVAVMAQEKAYDVTTDTQKVTEQAPLNSKYVLDSIVDGAVTIAANATYPASTGMSMDGYADMSLTGVLQNNAGTASFYVEATNDEDAASANWIQIYGFDTKNNTPVNSYSVTSGTLTFACDFDNLNYSLIRINLTVSTANAESIIIKMRRKAL